MDKSESQVEDIVEGLWSDISGRRGFDLNDLDEDVQEEIRTSWRAIISKGLK